MPPAPEDGPAQRRAGRTERMLAAAADRMPLGLRTARFAPTTRAAVALGLVGLLAVLVSVAAFLRSRPEEVRAPVTAPPATSASGPVVPPGPLPSASPQPSPSALLVVDVVGPVRRPGVVRLPPGSRVVDALAAAGGLKPGATSGLVNLAALLVDGQQVVLGPLATGGPAPPAVPSGATGPAGSTPAGSAVNLNTATLEQLDQLPGVGPVLAQRILDWRTANGRFTSVDQLAEIGGIGERRLADLRPRVRV